VGCLILGSSISSLSLSFSTDNHFTSVEGFRFDWTLTPSPSHVLQIVPFKGAAVDVRSIVLEMEEKVRP
jgi:hypothetical protein